MSVSGYANIMLLGKTGAGKSSFINYLTGSPVCKTGVGMPITPGFETFCYDDLDGIPIRIYDSKGLEVMDFTHIRQDIVAFIKTRCGDDDIKQWIHSIFYCINVETARIEPEEITLLKQLRSEVAQSVHIILTHCKQTEAGVQASERMTQYIREKLEDESIHVFRVNSVQTRLRKGTFAPFGRQEILDQIFALLWSDISHRISHDYALELYQGTQELMSVMKQNMDQIVKKFNTAAFLIAIVKEGNEINYMDEEFHKLEQDRDAIEEALTLKYRDKICPLIEFCNAYGTSMGKYIEITSFFDLLPEHFMDFDRDAVFRKSKLGQFGEELEAFSFRSANTIEKMRMSVRTVGTLISLKGRLRELLSIVEVEMRQSVPDVNMIEKAVYDKLMEGFHQKDLPRSYPAAL